MRPDRIRAVARSFATDMFSTPGPGRWIAILAVVQSIGFGIFLTSGAIFFKRTIGLTATQVGLGLSVANVFALLWTVPIGRLADRRGARLPLLVGYAALAGLFAVYCLVRSFTMFLIVTSLISVGETSVNVLRMTIIRAIFEPADRVQVSARARSLFNVGFLAGAVIAGGALAVGTRTAFYAAVLITAAAQAGCTAIVWRLAVPSRVRAPRQAVAKARSALRDIRFAGLTFLCGILEFYQPILTVGLPLWIITRTLASASVNSALLVLDTLIVFFFQVRMSRGAETTSGSARLLRRSGVLLAGSCLVFALTEHATALVAVPLLLVGTVVLVLGETSQAAGSFGISLHLPPPEKQGEYQGVFALSSGLEQTVGPVGVTALVVGLGRLGWTLLAALFLLAGLCCVPIARSAEKAVGELTVQPDPVA